MQRFRHSTVALLVAAAAFVCPPGAAAQAPAPIIPASGEASFVVFVAGREVGREQVTLSPSASGWTILSTGRLGEPYNLANNRFELTYAGDWQPIELKIDAQVQDRRMGLATSFGTTTAINEITQNGVTNSKTDQITVRTVVIPNNFYGAYEALAVRLSGLTAGAEVPVYVAPQGEIRLQVKSVTPSSYQTPAGTVRTRRYAVTFQNPGGPLEGVVAVDDRHRLASIEINDGALSVTRLDLAGVATRRHSIRNPTDVDVQVPAAGFGLAGTLTTPQAQGRIKHPAIVLVAGAGQIERDSVIAGIPLFAQLAGQLADLGFAVLRYDKRGSGQSGGRTETATLQEYADDAIAGVKWLAKRKDVDNRRIFVVGHSEGAAVAMLAAAREKRIAGIALMGGMGTTGRELVLEQQERLLAKTAEPDRTTKIDLQKQILEATVTEKGWEALPPDVRRATDTPWYRSLLTFDPAATMPRIKQPVLILQGSLDSQVPQHHADKLAELGKARKKAPPTEVKTLAPLNHLFVPATTGDTAEYETLAGKTIAPDVSKAIASWVQTVAP